ncbi:MAG: GxxExxY protein [Flavobacteriales bacterium]|nr:GxxExxY protein [Flavobacteriales bacterium]
MTPISTPIDPAVNQLSHRIIGIAIEVHQNLGPGLLESAYKACLAHRLSQQGIYFEFEKAIPLVFENVRLECGYRIDLVIENCLVLEIKSVEALNPVHLAQMITYLKLGNYPLGLLINFNVVRLKDGIKRVII